MKSSIRRIYSRQVLLICTIILIFSARSQETPSLTSPTILAHPAMFGKRWTPNVAANLHMVTWDLCNETIEQPDYLDTASEVNIPSDFDQQLYGIALYFDPFEKSGKQECRHATMAQVAEKKYPTAQYLLVTNTDLIPMTKFQDEPDTVLTLGTVTVNVGNDIRTLFGNGTISSGSILVNIDGTTRSIFDVNSEFEAYADAGPEMWITTTQVSGGLSFFGSLYVLGSLIGTKQRRTKNMRVPFNRLLLAISIADLISSLGMVFAGLALPKTPYGDYEGIYSLERWDLTFPGANGNHATCQTQAFFVHTGLSASAFFTGYMAVQTLLIVRYAWTEKQMKKAEYFFFATGLGIPIITVVWATAKGLFFPMEIGFCWMNRRGNDICELEDGGPLLDDYCKGDIPSDVMLIYQMVFGMAWIMLAMVVILYSMISVYLFVRKQERQAARWSTNAQEGRQQKRVLTKGIAIIGAYVLTWVPSIISLTPIDDAMTNPGIMNTIVAFFLPLQGFFNALIFSGFAEKCVGRLCFGRRDSKETNPRASTSTPTFEAPPTATGNAATPT